MASETHHQGQQYWSLSRLKGESSDRGPEVPMPALLGRGARPEDGGRTAVWLGPGVRSRMRPDSKKAEDDPHPLHSRGPGGGWEEEIGRERVVSAAGGGQQASEEGRGTGSLHSAPGALVPSG